MTTAVPDPRPCACGHSQAAHPVPTDCVRCTCTDYRPTVPDPRFRDQLAEDFRDLLVNAPAGVALWMGLHFDDVAARIEARVQAATKQGAPYAACGFCDSRRAQHEPGCPAALVSPAPAPRAEEGQ